MKVDQLAEQLQVSSTPVREAFRTLNHEGLLISSPHTETVVAPLISEQLEELYLIREELEALAIRTAVHRITETGLAELKNLLTQMKQTTDVGDNAAVLRLNREFHRACCNPCGYPYLVQLIDEVRDKCERYRREEIRAQDRMRRAFREHEEIYRAFKNRESEAAEEITRRHLSATRQIVLRHIQKLKPAVGA